MTRAALAKRRLHDPTVFTATDDDDLEAAAAATARARATVWRRCRCASPRSGIANGTGAQRLPSRSSTGRAPATVDEATCVRDPGPMLPATNRIVAMGKVVRKARETTASYSYRQELGVGSVVDGMNGNGAFFFFFFFFLAPKPSFEDFVPIQNVSLRPEPARP